MNIVKFTHNNQDHYYNLDLLVSFEYGRTSQGVGITAQIKRLLSPDEPGEAEIRLHFQGSPEVTISGPEAERLFRLLCPQSPKPAKGRKRS